jgi:methionine sulfoxide reductase heme-binding subunit
MSRQPWHVRYARALVYVVVAASIVGVGVVAAIDGPTPAEATVEARELYGLWALGLLLASMVAGPLAFVLPWLPVNGHLLVARRALGVSAFVCAVLHAATFVGPVVAEGNWTRLYEPGASWIVGLALAVPLLLGMAVLAVTSNDRAVRAVGPQRWKRWHRLVYVLLPAALGHAVCVGADFGVNRPPDVSREADAGCLVGMTLAAAAWVALFVLRRNGARWTPAKLTARNG